ncbi:hypothetical protein AB0M10_15555 [Streptomyces sp. NPDC051840]|uniref:hypothetical protein n=1 Tax=Streptomyces sp. NPDC051840 TaxID=3154752 RepID=UPI0034473DEC
MTTPVPITLSGTSRGDGTFTPALRLITQISASGHSTGTGSCVLTQAGVPGAFTDFALVPYGPYVYVDPAFAHVTSAVSRAGAGDTVGQWKRLSLTVNVPNSEYRPGPSGRIYSAYDQARLGFTAANMPVGETQQIAYAQFEQTPPASDADLNQFGSNLFDLEQASYEGRMLYEPIGTNGSTDYMTFQRSAERVSCGAYSGRLVYQSPPPANSYTAVRNFGTYPHLKTRRQTYADLKYRPFTTDDALPGTSPSVDAGGTPIPAPATLTLRPLRGALVRVEPGVRYQAQVSVAAEAAGRQFTCAILRFDSALNPVGTAVTGTPVVTAGAFKWQQAGAQALMEDNAVWAAVVPQVSTAGASRVVLHVDEHRLWIPSTASTKRAGASPARPWQPPRQLIVRLRATRVNLARNPSNQNSVWGWAHVRDTSVSASLTLLAAQGVDGNCARYTVEQSPAVTLIGGTSPVTGVTSVTGQNGLVERLKPSTVYTASVYVRPVLRAVPVTLWAHNGDQLVRGTSTPVFDAGGNTAYFRLSVTFKTTPTFGGSGIFTLGYSADDIGALYAPVVPGTNPEVWAPVDGDPASAPAWTQSGTYLSAVRVSYDGVLWQAVVNSGPWVSIGPLTFYFDQLLVEEADKVAPFFDGNHPSGDYMWEGAPGDSRSHYYRGKRVNQYRLDQIIQRQLGVGASYRIVYASAP